MEQAAEIINGGTEGEVGFTSLDMQYANWQTELHPETARHYNFQIIGGRATGTHAFNNGFHGLTIMPPSSKISWINYYTKFKKGSHSSMTY